MVDISTKTNERNDIGTVEDSDEIIWLNKKHTDEGLDHKDWQSLQGNIPQNIEKIVIN